MSKKVTDVFNDASGAPLVLLADMRPTQMTVGMREVIKKQAAFRAKRQQSNSTEAERYLDAHPILIVLGPDSSVYVIDHHHLALALLREGEKTAPVQIAHDFSDKTPAEFWLEMRAQNLLHLEDENGKTQPLTALPSKLTDLIDDPYRSLAWFVRNAGGFNKVPTPYAEFTWANYFRQHISTETVVKDFGKAAADGLTLAQRPAAQDLPGYIEPPLRVPAHKAKHPHK